MDGFVSGLRRNSSLVSVYAANIFLSFHFFLLIYIHSSFLNQFFSSRSVGFLFIAGSTLNLILFLTASGIVRKLSPYTYLLIAIFIEAAALIGLLLASTPFAAAFFFIIHLSVVPMILFSLDIYLESANKDESITGEVRGTYLTLANITLVMSPAIVGFILRSGDFSDIFFLSLLCLAPLLFISARYLSKIHAEHPSNHSIGESFKTIIKSRNLLIGVLSHFFLQFFYGFMVIYLPIYLINEIGFDWSTIGILFSIMLLPFILFEIPAGWIADKLHSERLMMTLGFGVMAISTALLVFLNEPFFIAWAILLFLTRTGASVTEVTIESFFFKQVAGCDAGFISVFRMMRPIGYIVAPTVIASLLFFTTLQTIFLVIAGTSIFASALCGLGISLKK